MKKWRLFGMMLLTTLCLSGCVGSNEIRKIQDGNREIEKLDSKTIDWSGFGLSERQIEDVEKFAEFGSKYKIEAKYEPVDFPEKLEKYSQIRILEREDVGIVNFSEIAAMEKPSEILEYFYERGYTMSSFFANSFYEAGTARLSCMDPVSPEFYSVFMDCMRPQDTDFDLAIKERATSEVGAVASSCDISIEYDFGVDKKVISDEWRSLLVEWELDYMESSNLESFTPGIETYNKYMEISRSQIFWGTEDWCSLSELRNCSIEAYAAKIENDGTVECEIQDEETIVIGNRKNGQIVLMFNEGDTEDTVNLWRVRWIINRM